MEKSETKQILVNVEDILKILQNFTLFCGESE